MTASRSPLHWGLLTVAAAGVVAVTAMLAASGVLPGETAVQAVVRGASSPEMRSLARRLRPLGTWWGILPGILLLLAVSRHARQRWWLWSLVLVVAPLTGEALQELVGRLRPHGAALGFPSGHATATAAFAAVTIYLVRRSRLGHAAQALLGIVAVLLTVAVGLSRIVLDAHWSLDVVAGFALGGASAAAAAWWDASHPLERLAGPPPSRAP